jgi:DNA-binding NarL/FixJ family response regulator
MKVLLVDDQPSVRQGLRMRIELEPDLTVEGEADNGLEAISLAQELVPDVVVMDVAMPEMDGITATRRLHELAPQISVVMLSIHGDSATRVEAREAGAAAFVEKQASVEELLAEIRRAVRRSPSDDHSSQRPVDTQSTDQVKDWPGD